MCTEINKFDFVLKLEKDTDVSDTTPIIKDFNIWATGVFKTIE